jgi:hypothetical protein
MRMNVHPVRATSGAARWRELMGSTSSKEKRTSAREGVRPLKTESE